MPLSCAFVEGLNQGLKSQGLNGPDQTDGRAPEQLCLASLRLSLAGRSV